MSEKKQGLKSVMSQLEKRFGKGTLMSFEEGPQAFVDVFSTGSIGLDLALGVGGLPFGRIVEIYGPESSGKTTLTLQAIAEVQRLGGVAAFIDAEALAKSGEVRLIVVDSVAALTPRAELEGEMGDAHMGLQARLMGQALRKLTAAANQTGTCIIFINQLRQKIGVTFGPSETTTGGNALKFYASVRLDIRRVSTLKEGEKVHGARTRVKVAKNKLAPPWGVCEFDILFGHGICASAEILDLGVRHGLVEKAGSWFSYDGERLGQGKEKARVFLEERPELLARMRAEVLAHARGAVEVVVEDGDDEAVAA
jgi:recombination protein RecA